MHFKRYAETNEVQVAQGGKKEAISTFWRIIYQWRGQLHKGKSSILASLLVLNETNVIWWQIGIWCQGCHDSFHRGQRSNISQDDCWIREETCLTITYNTYKCFCPIYKRDISSIRQFLTVPVEISTGLRFWGSWVIARFTVCWESNRKVRGALTKPFDACDQMTGYEC